MSLDLELQEPLPGWSPNSSPVLSAIEPVKLSFTVGDSATQITNTIVVADSDDTHIESAIITISNNYDPSEDIIAFVDGTITGVWNEPLGRMELSGSDILANYQTALRSLTYDNTAVHPPTSTRMITFSVNDGTANSNAQVRSVGVFGGVGYMAVESTNIVG